MGHAMKPTKNAKVTLVIKTVIKSFAYKRNCSRVIW